MQKADKKGLNLADWITPSILISRVFPIFVFGEAVNLAWLMLLVLLSCLVHPSALAIQNSDNWLVRERSQLSQEWSEYKRFKQDKKFDFRVCREKATGERIAANMRAEFVHACVRERRKSERDSRAQFDN